MACSCEITADKRIWCMECLQAKCAEAHKQADPETHQRYCLDGGPLVLPVVDSPVAGDKV